MIINCAVSFESKKKKIPDLSLPPCTIVLQIYDVQAQFHKHRRGIRKGVHGNEDDPPPPSV